MARPLRIQYEHALYHITGRGNERKKIFYGQDDYERFKKYLTEAQARYGFILHCYVLMGNHYHLVGETPHANLDAIMHSINGAYTTYFNKRRKRSGHLFQGRYKAILVERDSYLLELSRYVHLNPVRAHMVEKPEEYAYSSYQSYISPDMDDIVNRDLIWDMIAVNREKAPSLYREFVEAVTGEQAGSPLNSVYGGMILGHTQFIKGTLDRLENERVRKEDVSGRRALKTPVNLSDTVEAVSRALEVPTERITSTKGRQRNLAIYLTRRTTAFTNREIGQAFGNISCSAVTRVCERFEATLKTDAALRAELDRAMEKLPVLVKGNQ